MASKFGEVAGVGVGVGVGIGVGVGVGVEVEVGEIERVEEWKSELKQKSTRSRKSAFDIVGDNKKIRVLNAIISGTKSDHTPTPPPNREERRKKFG